MTAHTFVLSAKQEAAPALAYVHAADTLEHAASW
jgi:hypothetical protein